MNMTSCIASACLEHRHFDIDALYYSAPRCGLDEESFNALFHYSLLAADGRDEARAYRCYFNEIVQENILRDELCRRRLTPVSIRTLSDLAACLSMLRARQVLSAAADRVEVDEGRSDLADTLHSLGIFDGAA